MRVQRTGVAAFAAFCVLLLAGCGVGPGRAPAPDATPADRIVCGTGLGDDLPDQPPAGRVPAGFTAVAAHICDPSASREDEAGIWSGVLVQRLEGDLTPVLTALARPDDPRWAGPCTAVMVVAPDLWIEGADGRVIRVSFPVDGCGQPKTEDVLFALGLLTVVEERFEPLSLIESRAAEAAGCPTQAGLLVLASASQLGIEAEARVEASPVAPGDGIAVVPYPLPELPGAARIDGLRVCAYETLRPDGARAAGAAFPAGGAGLFAGVRTLDADTARAALAEVSSATPRGAACTEQASRFVVAYPLVGGLAASVSFSVEQDGCRRLIGSSSQAFSAPDVLLALLGS